MGRPSQFKKDECMQCQQPAAMIGGGKETTKKTEFQEKFMANDGIDKANIRNIVHFDIPASFISALHQIKTSLEKAEDNLIIYV